jgi:hypothetical protein
LKRTIIDHDLFHHRTKLETDENKENPSDPTTDHVHVLTVRRPATGSVKKHMDFGRRALTPPLAGFSDLLFFGRETSKIAVSHLIPVQY